MSYYFRKTLRHLLHIHIIGVGISSFYFSYQYAQNNGFFSWLFFGEFKPALKAAVWEVFLVIALLQNPVQDPVVNSSSQDFWWQTEYSILIKKVTDAADSSLSTS